MPKIRADLVGVVAAGTQLLAAGDEVPEGLSVHESLLDSSEEPKPEEPKPEEPKPEEPKPEDDDFSDMLAEEKDAPKAPVKAAPKGPRGAQPKKS